MKESLRPEKLYKEYLTGALGKENAAELLISLIEGSENTEIRVRSIKTLEKINFQNEKIFKTLENHLISDESAIVRASVANYLIQNFLVNCVPAFRWVIQHERSPLVLQLVFDSIDNFDSPQLESIKKDLAFWSENFSSKIGVVPQESKFFFELELLFAKGKRNYEIDPFSYKYFESLSDIKNGEPWLVIKDRHVESLNFNYFNWKFIKNNIDIVHSLSTLQDLDVYLCSLRKYSYTGIGLSTIPKSIGSLIYLKKLILRRNGLMNLPYSIKNLTFLKELDLSYNKFKEIPQTLMFLKSLEKLNLKHNKIQGISDEIQDYINSLETFKI
ncbi:MAG: hypothetical protein ACFFDY_06420 [Candidatus Thorarchaeota archaeon]